MSTANDSTSVEYRDIPGFPGYRVGDDGSVWSCWTSHREMKPGVWKRQKPQPRPHGYLKVTLYRDGVPHQLALHRVVLLSFVGPCPEGMEACHLPDFDPSNCRLDNLRWDTRQANRDDTTQAGRIAKGHKVATSRLTETDVQEARRLRATGLSCRKIAAVFGVTKRAIQCIDRGLSWTHLPHES